MINRPSFILLNIFFLVQLCAGQADTTLLRWYPLDKGNYWQYSFYYSDWRIPEFSSGHFSMEVVGDTVMPNGKQYAIIERRSLPDTSGASYIYQRVDTTTANVYQYCAESPGGEFLIDSLASQVWILPARLEMDIVKMKLDGLHFVRIYTLIPLWVWRFI